MSVNSDAVIQSSSQALCSGRHEVGCGSQAHDRLRGAGWLGTVTLTASSLLLCGQRLIPKGQVILVATICRAH